MGKKRHARQGAVGYKPVDIGRAGRLGEPGVDTDATQTGASQHPAGGLGHSDPTGAQPTGGSSTGVVVGHPEGGLYQARGAGGAPSNARAAQLEDGTVDELVVTGSLTSGDLKLSGHILSSSAGKLLVSAGVVGIGTSMVDLEHDKLVVNGPIRLTDAGSRPHCDASRRGMIWHEFGDVGAADTVDVCAKDATDSYNWQTLIGAGGSAHSQLRADDRSAAGSQGGLIRNFRVAAKTEVQPGDVVSFVEGHVKRGTGAYFGEGAVFLEPAMVGAAGGAGKRRSAMLALSPDLGIIVHGGGANAQSMAQIAHVRGTSVELAGKAAFGAKRGDHVELSALSSASFLAVYSDATKREVGYAVLGSLSKDKLKFTQPLVMEPTGCTSLTLATLSPSLAVAAFNGNAATGRGDPTVLAMSVEGQKISFGSASKIEGRLDGFVLVPLSTSRFVLVYRNLHTKEVGARVGTVRKVEVPVTRAEADGESDEPLVETEHKLAAVMAAEAPVPTLGRILTYLVAARLSATQIVIAYADSETGSVLVADVAGDTVTPNSPTTFARSKPLSLSLSGLGPSSFILSFYTNDPWKTVMTRGTLSGGVHGSGLSLAETVFSSDYVTHTHSIALSDRTFLLSYYDGGNSDAGTAVAGSYGRGLGIAAATATEGDMVPVRFGGISSDHMSLEVGACYFSTDEGRLTTEPTSQAVGLAVSVNEVLMGSC